MLEEMETTHEMFSPGGIYKLCDLPELSHVQFQDIVPISAINSVGLENVREMFRQLVP